MKTKQMQEKKSGSMAQPDFGNGGHFPSRVGKGKTARKNKE